MNFKMFIKEKLFFILYNMVLFLLISFMMIIINVSFPVIFFLFIVWFSPLFTYILLEFFKKKSFFSELSMHLENLEKKYLIPEVLSDPDFIEGKIFLDTLHDISKDMHENVKYYRAMQADYMEYIEMWVHEIKTPIASTKLLVENNNNPITVKISSQVDKIEGFVEQVLYYSRGNDISKDYIIKEFSLKVAVTNVIRKNSRDFIAKRISLNMDNLTGTVFSDIKWVEFIINQIISNSIKYSKDSNANIKIYSIENENSLTLCIEDNGVGIGSKDINKVVEKGFTGENGRKFGKATGMGLYICNNLCKKLGLGMKVTSTENEGTMVSIIFPLGKITNF